ncbi:MAG TPA: hypothetical protein O0X39_01375 [Methanocorpusculum sp.]|nr:hypothetical protein [Methanocorpusculum sp.]
MSLETETNPQADTDEKKRIARRLIIIDIAALVMSFVTLVVENMMRAGDIVSIAAVPVILLVITVVLLACGIVISFKASGRKLLSKGVTVFDIVAAVITIFNVITILRHLGVIPF